MTKAYISLSLLKCYKMETLSGHLPLKHEQLQEK
ncbi:hypothetical protein ABIB50_002413 [Mucilaginibacter sp. UYCu711]